MKVVLPDADLEKIRRWSQPPTTEEERNQHQNIGPLLLDRLGPLGIHWSTKKEIAQIGASQGGGYGGTGILIEAEYLTGEDMKGTAYHKGGFLSEEEVTMFPDAPIKVTGIYLPKGIGLEKKNLLKEPVVIGGADEQRVDDGADILSPETRELIAVTASRLPRTNKEWEEIRTSSGPTLVEDKRRELAKSEESFASVADGKAEWWKKRGAPDDFLEQVAEALEDAERHRQAAREFLSGERDEEIRDILIRSGEDDPDHRVGFERDVNGKILPPPAFLERVDDVQLVGRSAHEDYKKALNSSPELEDLYARRNAVDEELHVHVMEIMRLEKEAMERRQADIKAKTDGIDDVDDWLDAMLSDAGMFSEPRELNQARERAADAQAERAKVQREIQSYRSALLRQVVTSMRPTADPEDIDVQSTIRPLEDGPYGPEAPATEEELDLIRRASTFFPKDWVDEMNKSRGTLFVSTSPRGYYRQKSPFSYNPGDQLNVSGFGANPDADRGAFANYPEQVATHEIGHRMERTFPAIPRLEWAFLVRRATHDNKREPSLWVGVGDVDETGLHDEFTSPYTGRTYGNLDSAPWKYDGWEVFTTGLEALYGEDDKYADPSGELQSFVLGLLLTVR